MARTYKICAKLSYLLIRIIKLRESLKRRHALLEHGNKIGPGSRIPFLILTNEANEQSFEISIKFNSIIFWSTESKLISYFYSTRSFYFSDFSHFFMLIWEDGLILWIILRCFLWNVLIKRSKIGLEVLLFLDFLFVSLKPLFLKLNFQLDLRLVKENIWEMLTFVEIIIIVEKVLIHRFKKINIINV